MNDGGITPSLGPPPSPEALSGMIKMLSANPDLVKNIATAFGNAGINPPSIEKENNDNPETATVSANGGDLSSKLGGILSALSQSGNNSEKNEPAQSKEAPTVSASALPSIPPELISKLPLILSLVVSLLWIGLGGRQRGTFMRSQALSEPRKGGDYRPSHKAFKTWGYFKITIKRRHRNVQQKHRK